MSKRKKTPYNEEFKKEAVRLALESGKPKSQIARDLGIGASLLYDWIKRLDPEKEKNLTESNEDLIQQMRKLKADNKLLQEENALLKKAATYFAKNIR